ncbi:MAG: hypothetical protein ABW036_04395 [Flavitalea sp.]
MKRTRILVFIITATSFSFACNKKDSFDIDCGKLKQGLIERNPEQIRSALPSNLGQHSYEGFKALANNISASCEFEITTECYGCLYSLPPGSILGFSFKSDTGKVDRGITILGDFEGPMSIAEVN